MIVLFALVFLLGCDGCDRLRFSHPGLLTQFSRESVHVYDIKPGMFETIPPHEKGFHPIRIHTEWIEGVGSDDKSEFFKNVAVPHVTRLVSRVFQVPDLGNLRHDVLYIHSDICKDRQRRHNIMFREFPKMDLVVFLEVTLRCDFYTRSMQTSVCQSDAFGRPQVGKIQICENHLQKEWAKDTPRRESVLMETLLHEFYHVLGFNAHTFSRRWGLSGRRYSCVIDPISREPRVVWNLEGHETANTYYYHFHPEVLQAIDARGLKASECRCPLDPNREYSNEDIEYCILYPNHCAVAIVSPKVVEKAREYYACESAKGMEIENGRFEPSCRFWFLDLHWKTRLALGEILNPARIGRYSFVSPMTLAFLEDSGGYKIDYSVFAPPLPGITWGHLKGCPFLFDECISPSTGQVVDKDAFCRPIKSDRKWKCSKDALTVLYCFGTLPAVDTSRVPELPQYKYLGNQRYFDSESVFDHCPVFRDFFDYSCVDKKSRAQGVTGAHSRCFDRPIGPACLRTKCANDGMSYRVENSREISTCTRAGQLSATGLVCEDPSIICADMNAFHALPALIPIPNAGI